MSDSLDILESALLSLPASGRARLAHRLLASLASDPEVDPAWAADVRARIREWQEGRLEALPLAMARAAIRERYRSRKGEPA